MPRSLRNFQGSLSATLQIKPLQEAKGPGERLEPLCWPCFPRRPFGLERRANAFQEDIRIFMWKEK